MAPQCGHLGSDSFTRPSQTSHANISSSGSSIAPIVLTFPSFMQDSTIWTSMSNPFNATSVWIACSKADSKSSGVSKTLPSSTYVRLTTRTPSSVFASGVSTATPRLRATRREATSHIRLKSASLGESVVLWPIVPAITSAAGVIP